MATKAQEEFTGPRDRRRQRGTVASSDKMQPPDKKKHEKDMAVLSKEITDKEAGLKLISWNSTQQLSAEISQLSSELDLVEKEKDSSTKSLREIEEEIPSLGKKVTDKKSEASKLIAGLRHNTESKIDDAVSKLELGLQTRRHSLSEERKVRKDIEALINSKARLSAWQQLKAEIESMRERQARLRKERDSLYRIVRDLKEKAGSLKDAIVDKKAKQEKLNFQRKEAIAHKDTIEKEINDLKLRRKKLQDDFRTRQQEYSAATEVERSRQREQERRQVELRREIRQSRKKQHTPDLLHQRKPQYDVEKQICSALIAYIEKLSIGHSSTDHAPSATPTQLTTEQSTQGELQLVKKEEDEVLVPASYRKKSKRDKRRNAVGTKPGKRLNHYAAVFGQFSHIGLAPPPTVVELPATLALLQEKLTFYSSKSETGQQAESEAGDSGVYSTVYELSDDLNTPLTTSQEDINSDLSPRRSLTDPTGGLKLITMPEKSVTSSFADQPQPMGNSLVTNSINSLTTQSSTSSSVANAVANGVEE